jgi:hypothetical protein
MRISREILTFNAVKTAYFMILKITRGKIYTVKPSGDSDMKKGYEVEWIPADKVRLEDGDLVWGSLRWNYKDFANENKAIAFARELFAKRVDFFGSIPVREFATDRYGERIHIKEIARIE